MKTITNTKYLTQYHAMHATCVANNDNFSELPDEARLGFVAEATALLTRLGDNIFAPGLGIPGVMHMIGGMGRNCYASHAKHSDVSRRSVVDDCSPVEAIERAATQCNHPDCRKPYNITLADISECNELRDFTEILKAHATTIAPSGNVAIRARKEQVPALCNIMRQEPRIFDLPNGTVWLHFSLATKQTDLPVYADGKGDFQTGCSEHPQSPPAADNDNPQPYTVLSLFSGGGGFDIGFEQAGFRTLCAVEFSGPAGRALKRYLPHVQVIRKDIRRIPGALLPRADVLIGGSPCQSFSNNGNRLGLEDERGKLIFDYLRILASKGPKAFVFENAPTFEGLFRYVLDGLLLEFNRLGYNVTWQVLDVSDFGVPQTRRRTIVVGIRRNIGGRFDFAKMPKCQNPVTQRDVIWHLRGKAFPQQGKGVPVTGHEFATPKFSPQYIDSKRWRDWDEPAFTVIASNSSARLHPDPVPFSDTLGVKAGTYTIPDDQHLCYRRLTIAESAALQTFPEDYPLDFESVGSGYSIIGNAVPPRFAHAIATELMRVLREAEDRPLGTVMVRGAA